MALRKLEPEEWLDVLAALGTLAFIVWRHLARKSKRAASAE